ncbi:TIGR01777 family oxidoreductase [Paenibacillus sp. LHD-117]|uniref:TIGR01777 family oxidoreductase n=1 Tax=Paenibacillus sp. LHD-117 TaxID=3071412 RepID=UPI0035A93B9B
MRIAVTGGTGFIGKALVKALVERGDTVWIISRQAASTPEAADSHLRSVSWDMLEKEPAILEGIDTIVNLAGESINQRWTKSAKNRVLSSRQWAAARVAKLVLSLEAKPSVVVNASGISAYGISERDVFHENSPTAVTDFLSGVVKHWEEAADAIPVPRLVKLRIGLVLARKGGAFPLIALPYRLFGGGRVGSGKQGLSWIHIEDMIGLILFCLDNETVSGPVNASAPEPVSNDEFGRAVGRALSRPHWFPVPAVLMKALFGEMSTLLLDGQRALPTKSLELGFRFCYPTLDKAMRQLLVKSHHE